MLTQNITKYHEHTYICYDLKTNEIIQREKLPPILKIIRIENDYAFKVPHGNRIRTMILEEGVCYIYDDFGEQRYVITIERW